MLRRNLTFFGQGELGGKTGPKIFSGFFLFFLWILFVILVSANSYGYIMDPFKII